MATHASFLQNCLSTPAILPLIVNGSPFQFEDFWKFTDSDMPEYLEKIKRQIEENETHLSHYRRSIFGEEYIAMEFAPVPSGIYDGSKCNPNLPLFKGQLEVNRYYAKSRMKPNLDFLSETDIECLQESISENGCLSFDALVEKSHSFAYNNAIRSHISIIDMAKEGGGSDEMIE